MTSLVLQDSPSELQNASDVEPQGRTYDERLKNEPGAIRIDDLVLGMKLASVAITDDKEGTLAKVGKSNPWHIEALKVITGSEEEAHKPLSRILSKHFGLECDHHIDVSGYSKAGHPLDTQGYIAHNDEMIVLAFRCTTSGKDWLTNLSTSSSEWEPEIDIPQGHSGHFSCLQGLCCEDQYKPRVHTGFYNNFLVSAPLLQKYIDPLLAPDQPPRKLYVVGHSLGAGIATLAACYFLLEHQWQNLPHKLIHITAGSPRAVRGGMRDIITEKMNTLRPLDKAVICRIVRDQDVVSTVPPSVFGFVHLDTLVFITRDGDILINPDLDGDMGGDSELNKLQLLESDTETDMSEDERDNPEEGKMEKTAYEKKVSMIPRALRDHMPDFYLKPLIDVFEKENPPSMVNKLEEEEGSAIEEPIESPKRKRRFKFFRRGKKRIS